MLECTFRNGLDKNAVSKELVNAIDEQEKLLKYFSTKAAIVDYVESTAESKQDVLTYIQEKTRDVEQARKAVQPNYVPAPFMYFQKFSENVKGIAYNIATFSEFTALKGFRENIHSINYLFNKRYSFGDDKIESLVTLIRDLGYVKDDTELSNSLYSAHKQQLYWSTACNLQSSGFKDIFGKHESVVYYTYRPSDKFITIGVFNDKEVESDLDVILATALLYANSEKKTLKYAFDFFQNYKTRSSEDYTAYPVMKNTASGGNKFVKDILDYIKGNDNEPKITALSEYETSLCHSIIKDIIDFNNEHEIADGLPEENIGNAIKPALVDYMLKEQKRMAEIMYKMCEDKISSLEEDIEHNIDALDDLKESSGMRM